MNAANHCQSLPDHQHAAALPGQRSIPFKSIIIKINATTLMHITKLYPHILAFRTSRPETARFLYC
jgi:hypothetical protein